MPRSSAPSNLVSGRGDGGLRAPAHDLARPDLVGRLPAAVYTARSGSMGEWLYVSPEIEAVLGFAPEDFLSDPGLWARQLHPEDRDRVLADEEGVRVPGHLDRACNEYRMIGRNGQVVWVLDDVAIQADAEHGTLQHGLLYDVTSRKRTEQLLAAQADIVERVARGDVLAETLQALAESTGRLMHVTDCVVVVNQAASGGSVLRVGAAGVVDPGEGIADELGVAFHDNHGEPLGYLVVEPYPGQSTSEAEALTWASRLAALAVARANQDEQTKTSFSLLQATLESTADGILVVDESGVIAGYNQKFVQMWQMPQELMAAGDDDRLIGFALGQLTNPDAFVAEVRRLYSSPEESSFDVLDFRDGRVFERYSQPQFVDGHAVGRVWSFRDMTSYRQLEKELRTQAYTDELTTLPNRHYFMERLTGALLRGEHSSRHMVGVLLLDIDDFKTVNDSLGHLAGDALLVTVAERLRACLRAEDTAARLGGDEFVVLLEDLEHADHASTLAERILRRLSEPMEVDGRSVSVRASIGIAFTGDDMAPGDLLRNADLAMYTAKREGGARHRLYACPMHTEALSRLDLQADLAHAVDRGELRLDYQPVVGIDSQRIKGFEALVRWEHPERGLIPPADFIPLAEETGLIDEVGRWVLETAFDEAAAWVRLSAIGDAPMVFVNVSPRQLSNPSIVEEIRRALVRSGLPAASVCLEITETALAWSDTYAIDVLSDIKSLGVRLALDDFGSGYSSLGRLDLYPLDVLKIDRSFIDRLDDRGNTAIVEAVLRLAAGFGLEVVAEGIETEHQMRTLASLGCPTGQGYLLSRPVPAAAARAMLAGA